jgi:hypothetical protein
MDNLETSNLIAWLERMDGLQPSNIIGFKKGWVYLK